MNKGSQNELVIFRYPKMVKTEWHTFSVFNNSSYIGITRVDDSMPYTDELIGVNGKRKVQDRLFYDASRISEKLPSIIQNFLPLHKFSKGQRKLNEMK